jgi:hypothetical protein
MSPPNQDRRRVIKAIVKGVVYSAPLVTSMAAPAGLMGQGPSGMMMTFCDYFPVLCMIFGGSQATTPGAPAPGGQGGGATPGTPPPATPTPPPPTPPSPGQANPPPGR